MANAKLYVLELLRRNIAADRWVEYRLLSAGGITPAVRFDWTSSDAARQFLSEPVQLINVSLPPDLLPQEFALQFPTGMVTEESGPAGVSMVNQFSPDAEIARDIAALLSLICRQPLTVMCKTREVVGGDHLPNFMRDFSFPIWGHRVPPPFPRCQ